MDSRSRAVTSVPSSHPVCEFGMHEGLFAMFSHRAWAVHLRVGGEHAPDLSPDLRSLRGGLRPRCSATAVLDGTLGCVTVISPLQPRRSDGAISPASDIEPESDASLTPSQTCFCMVCGEVAPPARSSAPPFRHLAARRVRVRDDLSLIRRGPLDRRYPDLAILTGSQETVTRPLSHDIALVDQSLPRRQPSAPKPRKRGCGRAVSAEKRIARVGSSPRGRGTRRDLYRSHCYRRFIPARAGNTTRPSRRATRTPVHPRAGGEHRNSAARRWQGIGSSPRGRGTPPPRKPGRLGHRFIPARAGNTPCRAPRSSPIAVHPRAGGEHPAGATVTAGTTGSSPRGRGTRPELQGARHHHRFIPARAGNTSGPGGGRRREPVHPRAGGEHVSMHHCMSWMGGSSPRGRGTPVRLRRLRGAHRFIPARAGNTQYTLNGSTSPTVHPRAGGEHMSMTLVHAPDAGSSPRGRGTQSSVRWRRRPRRFIPARAGNTSGYQEDAGGWTVHPRAGGEHRRRRGCGCAVVGSSPRGRGTRHMLLAHRRTHRFIPARAGNTDRADLARNRPPVHPRAGGEHAVWPAGCAEPVGSSPRGRGTRLPGEAAQSARRFIPARAGNTLAAGTS